MRLNVRASELTSSPPPSAARTSVRPCPSAVAASSSARSRLCVGRKIANAVTAAPTPSMPSANQARVGPTSHTATNVGGASAGTSTVPISVPSTVIGALSARRGPPRPSPSGGRSPRPPPGQSPGGRSRTADHPAWAARHWAGLPRLAARACHYARARSFDLSRAGQSRGGLDRRRDRDAAESGRAGRAASSIAGTRVADGPLGWSRSGRRSAPRGTAGRCGRTCCADRDRAAGSGRWTPRDRLPPRSTRPAAAATWTTARRCDRSARGRPGPGRGAQPRAG